MPDWLDNLLWMALFGFVVALNLTVLWWIVRSVVIWMIRDISKDAPFTLR